MQRVLFSLAVMSASLPAQMLTPVWTELGENGTVARVVVNAPDDCPAIDVDGLAQRMSLRLPVPDGLRPVCELQISPYRIWRRFKAPRSHPARIAARGSRPGCRHRRHGLSGERNESSGPLRAF